MRKKIWRMSEGQFDREKPKLKFSVNKAEAAGRPGEDMTGEFTIISENPEPIVRFIHEDLNRSATVYRAEGTYLHQDKTVILAVTKRRQAVLLRNFVKVTEPGAFLMITNSSEIIGKGFQGY